MLCDPSMPGPDTRIWWQCLLDGAGYRPRLGSWPSAAPHVIHHARSLLHFWTSASPPCNLSGTVPFYLWLRPLPLGIFGGPGSLLLYVAKRCLHISAV